MPFSKLDHRSSLLLSSLNAVVFVASIGLLVYSILYVRKPGPKVYYSHFFSLYLSACLAFQTLQVYRVTRSLFSRSRGWRSVFRYIYLTALTLASLIEGIALCFTPKPDTTAVAFLAFLDGLIGLSHYKLEPYSSGEQIGARDCVLSTVRRERPNEILQSNGDLTEMALMEDLNMSKDQKPQSRFIRFCHKSLRVGNRFLMVIHVLLVLLSVAGSVELALAYRYANPGTLVQVKLPSGETYSLNYNCTYVQSLNGSQPTIWFEADDAHGIVDFLGVQISLASEYGRNSCSYDPPNFGWSERRPADLENFFDYFVPLLQSLGREDEEKVIVGWGDGAENALMHTIANADSTKALVIMDASPDGIEWLDAQRKNNWTEAQMLNYRSEDLNGRIFLTETILGLGIPWGLMPVFNPSNSTGYFSPSAFPRYHAQSMKEDFWAVQYYYLIKAAASSINKYLVNTTAPETVKVYTLMTYNAGNPVTDEADNQFYRTTKLDMAKHIAGGNLSAPVVWCMDSDCSLGFPVDKPGWTAGALMSLGI